MVFHPLQELNKSKINQKDRRYAVRTTYLLSFLIYTQILLLSIDYSYEPLILLQPIQE